MIDIAEAAPDAREHFFILGPHVLGPEDVLKRSFRAPDTSLYHANPI